MTDAALRRVLDLARWAPSGDNTQPWRFRIAGPRHAVVEAFDTRAHCVYDLDGRASQVSVGALVQTAEVAASAERWRVQATRRPDSPETAPVLDLHFSDDAGVEPSPLLPAITTRSVQRRPLSTRPLHAHEKAALAAAVGPAHELCWIEGDAGRREAARLLWHSAGLRLTLPEAYPTHRDVIEWNADTSIDRVPDGALGVPLPSRVLMRWALRSWRRVDLLNRYAGGTLLPRFEMDWRPALGCAAHFLLLGRQGWATIDDALAGGRAMQRLWLTAEHLGLRLQPAYTPLVFAHYAHTGLRFTALPAKAEQAAEVGDRLARLWGGAQAARRAVFMGRIGEGPAATARSLRLPLEQLWA